MNETNSLDLDDALLDYLKAVDRGQAPDLGEWCGRYPQFADELRAFVAWDHQLEGMAAIRTSVVGDTPLHNGSSKEDGLCPTRAGRFDLSGELGRGGIGTVLRAHDPVLNRPLAVKLLQARHRGRGQIANRFLAEARITARLQHPGVPPVHDVGEADGRPYIAMKLIEGSTLASLLRERPTLSSDLPRFLKVFDQVAQTIAYAHSRGVVHRDLKPQNVMTGAFGEVQVMDWGLAKELQIADCRLQNEGVDERSNPQSAIPILQTGMTQSGAVIGTPAYMAPEQARADEGLDERRADVFGLGAILCEILTGRPPFANSAPLDLSRSGNLTEAFQRLDRCGCDAGLTDLAKRCLDPDPMRRPADGQAVAQAITGYFTGVQDRLRQAELSNVRTTAIRKQRRVVRGLGALTLVLVVIGLSSVLAVQAQANANLTQKNTELAAANDRERQRFDLALEAIGLFHGEVSQDLLLKEKQFGPLRMKLLRGAADFYGRLQEQIGEQDSPASQATLARSFTQLGGLRHTMGDRAEALTVHRQALDIQRRLAASPDAKHDYSLAAASSLLAIGVLQLDVRDPEATTALNDARALVERVEAEHGASRVSRALLAQIIYTHAYLLLLEGQIDSATAGYEKSSRMIESLAGADSKDLQLRMNLGNAYLQLGVAATNAKGHFYHMNKALEQFEACRAADPLNPEYQHAIGHCHMATAGIVDSVEVPLAELLAHSEEALELLSKLVADYPTITEFQRVQALAGYHAGRRYLMLNRPGDARVAAEKTRSIWEKLNELSAGVPQCQAWLSRSHSLVADIDLDAGNISAALSGYSKAVAIVEDILNKTPTDEYRCVLAMNIRKLALAKLAAGHPAEAAADTKRARDLLKPNLMKLTHFHRLRIELAACHATLSGLAGKPGTGVPASDGPIEAAKATELLKSNSSDYRPHPLVLTRDRGFDSLRGRPDFEEFLRDAWTITKPMSR